MRCTFRHGRISSRLSRHQVQPCPEKKRRDHERQHMIATDLKGLEVFAGSCAALQVTSHALRGHYVEIHLSALCSTGLPEKVME